MSKAIYVESAAATATAIHCSDCDDEAGKESRWFRDPYGRCCFYEGNAAIEQHRVEHPDHQKIVWLKTEVA